MATTPPGVPPNPMAKWAPPAAKPASAPNQPGKSFPYPSSNPATLPPGVTKGAGVRNGVDYTVSPWTKTPAVAPANQKSARSAAINNIIAKGKKAV